jgi:hypothetical protein
MIGYDGDLFYGHFPTTVEPRSDAGRDVQAVQGGDFIVEKLPSVPPDTWSAHDGQRIRA